MPDLKELAFSLVNLKKCKGFDTVFIKKETKLSLDKILSIDQKKLLPEVDGNKNKILHYTGLSILYNAKRKLPFVAAYNINGNDKQNNSPRPAFKPDPRLKDSLQLDKPFYALKKRGKSTVFQIGHMASNNEMGRGKNGPLQAAQTFHFTNASPQAGRLNAGLWKGLESYIITHAATLKGNKRICVFTGPVLTSFDPGFTLAPAFKVPLLFYKVIVFATPSGLHVTGFLMSHEKKLLKDKMLVIKRGRAVRGAKATTEGFFNDFPYKKVFQVNIPLLEKETGLRFSWPKVKMVEVPEQKRLMEKIKKVENAKDAKEIIRVMRGPLDEIKMTTSVMDITDTELKNNNYFLNMVIPE
jgi:DNA/RNA endonuclease G (NUC1)